VRPPPVEGDARLGADLDVGVAGAPELVAEVVRELD
jgi:hypothetical protein